MPFLRFAWNPLGGSIGNATTVASKDVIATYEISGVDGFATVANDDAQRLNASLARFRGFIVLDASHSTAPRAEYHAALARFAELRARSLVIAK